MRLEKYRHIQILKSLIEAERELTSDDLAKLTGSSLRTIKNDIRYLNSLCMNEGICEIRPYKAKGYKMINADEA